MKINVEQISNRSISTSSTNLEAPNEINSKCHRRLSWESQEQQDDNRKPLWIWCVCGVEIFLTFFHMGLFVFSISENEYYYPHVHILQIPVLLTRLFMGFIILVGLKSERTFHTRFCFKFWILCHMVLFALIVVEIAEIRLYDTSTSFPKMKYLPSSSPVAVLIAFVYRVIIVIMVMLFLGTTRQFESIELEDVVVCGDDDESEE